jgi:hypothetical protein
LPEALSPQKPGLGVPTCFYGPDYVGYSVKSIDNQPQKTVAILELKKASGFVKDVQEVTLEITHINDYSVR